MKSFIIRLLGGFTSTEVKLKVQAAREAEHVAYGRQYKEALARLQKGDKDYGVRPLEEYEAHYFLCGVE
jgi:hypothetical protein